MHSGQGRRRPPLSRGDQLQRQAIQALFKRRKAKLRDDANKETNAEKRKAKLRDVNDTAADEAREFARDRYGIILGASTILQRW